MKGCYLEGTKIEERGFGYTMDVLSGKYKMIIIYWLEEKQVMRYSEIKRIVGNITHKMLSDTLKELERDGLLIRKEYPQVPPKVEYSLTEKGKSLMPIMSAMCDWGDKYRNVK